LNAACVVQNIQAKRVQAEVEVAKPKRVLTPEQKAAAAERMAKARAARKPKVEPVVQADAPAQAVPGEE
jgi:Spy/CpxP family protein refolding chaperone